MQRLELAPGIPPAIGQRAEFFDFMFVDVFSGAHGIS
jgi:hypothetical protein